MNDIKISASLLGSDLSNIAAEAARARAAGAHWTHIDVMDGHFVENISFGAPVQRAIKGDYFKDTHLMVSRPYEQIPFFAEAGSDMITFHIESESDPSCTVNKIHQAGIRAGLAIKPDTPAEAVFPFLEQLEMVLVMTVEPGYGGQGFLEFTLPKIRQIRERAALVKPSLMIQVDGGINAETAKAAKAAGADVLVTGSYLFKAADMEKAVDELIMYNG